MISIRFLGTGGARFVVAKQIRSSGGMWLTMGATQVHVDPGPGALVRALSAVPPCRPAELDGIVLSHKHLDHAGDVNAVIEAMCQGGWRPRGALVAPADALAGEPVVFPYAARFVPTVHESAEGAGPFALGEVDVRTGVRLQHAVETYTLHFTHAEGTVSYVPCTRYFDGIAEDVAAHRPAVLVINTLLFEAAAHADHLSFPQAQAIVAAVRPGTAILSHFGTRMLERDPRRLAGELEDATGIRTYAAYDGWTFDAA